MADLATLTALRERVIAATGPVRELDAEFWILTDGHDDMTGRAVRFAAEKGAAAYLDEQQKSIGGMNWRYCSTGSKPDPFFGVLPVTASIDAALALLERMLPGWEWRVQSDQFKGASASLSSVNYDPYSVAHAHTAPLAILAALLSARIEKEKPNG